MFNSNYYNHLQPFCSSVGLDKFSTILSSDVLSHWCTTLPTPVNQMPSCEDVWRCVTLTWWWQRTPMRKLKLESAKHSGPLSPYNQTDKKCERLQKWIQNPKNIQNHPRFPQWIKLGFLTQLGHGGDSSGNALVWWVHAQLEESSSAQTKQGPEGPEHPETVAIPSLNLSPQEEHEPLTTRVQSNCSSNSKSNSNSLSLSRFPLWSKRDLLLQLEQNGTSVANI